MSETELYLDFRNRIYEGEWDITLTVQLLRKSDIVNRTSYVAIRLLDNEGSHFKTYVA
jgi:hypothetical protein